MPARMNLHIGQRIAPGTWGLAVQASDADGSAWSYPPEVNGPDLHDAPASILPFGGLAGAGYVELDLVDGNYEGWLILLSDPNRTVSSPYIFTIVDGRIAASYSTPIPLDLTGYTMSATFAPRSES